MPLYFQNHLCINIQWVKTFSKPAFYAQIARKHLEMLIFSPLLSPSNTHPPPKSKLRAPLHSPPQSILTSAPEGHSILRPHVQHKKEPPAHAGGPDPHSQKKSPRHAGGPQTKSQKLLSKPGFKPDLKPILNQLSKTSLNQLSPSSHPISFSCVSSRPRT